MRRSISLLLLSVLLTACAPIPADIHLDPVEGPQREELGEISPLLFGDELRAHGWRCRI
jgi:hypothetical protein